MKFDKTKQTIIYQPGEVLKLNVTAEGTEHSVDYHTGQENIPLEENRSATIDVSQTDSPLALDFRYSEPEGGIYKIEITGSAGGVTRVSVPQTGKTSEIITFGLEGDPDVDF